MNRIIQLAKTYRDPRCWWRNVTWRFPRTISEGNPVFVVGAPRSGTTLLQRMLSVHPNLFSIEAETGLFSMQNIFDPARRHFDLPFEEARPLLREAKDIVHFFELGVKHVQSDRQGGRFVEKTPQHVLHLPFILKHFPRASIVHIVRDGRDCFCSSRSNPHVRQNTVPIFARYWSKCVKRPLAISEGSQRILTIKYEDLSSDAEAVLGEIMPFLGLQLDDAQLDPGEVGKDARANLHEFKRLASKVDTSSVERWKKELSDEEICTFEEIAGVELKHYGYELCS